MIPPERSPAVLYRRMFVQGTPSQVAARTEDLRIGRSALDFVNDRAKALRTDLGPKDRDRLDQSPACLNVVDFKDPVRARLMLFNDTSHYAGRPRVPDTNLSKWWDVEKAEKSAPPE